MKPETPRHVFCLWESSNYVGTKERFGLKCLTLLECSINWQLHCGSSGFSCDGREEGNGQSPPQHKFFCLSARPPLWGSGVRTPSLFWTRPWHLPSLPRGPLTLGDHPLCPLDTFSSFSALMTACRRLWQSLSLPLPWNSSTHMPPGLIGSIFHCSVMSLVSQGWLYTTMGSLSVRRCSCCMGAQRYQVGWDQRYIFSVVPPQLLTGTATERAELRKQGKKCVTCSSRILS